MEVARQRRKLILILMILTPGIPEYLTGSSKLSTFLFNPAFFFVQTFINIGMYTTGAILIREFVLRHNRGWGSILLLGLAYGIMEEGVAVHTFFLPSGNPVALLGSYGRYAGLDWLWAIGISSFHSVYSITLPLLILNLAYPSTSRQNLLGSVGYRAAFLIYVFIILFADLFVVTISGFTPPASYIVFLIIVALVLVVIASLLPAVYLSPRKITHRHSPRRFFILGVLILPIFFLYSSILPRIKVLPPFVEVLFIVAAYVTLLRTISRSLPMENPAESLKWLVYGILTPSLIFAALAGISLTAPLIFIPIVIALFMLAKFNRIIRKNQSALLTTAG